MVSIISASRPALFMQSIRSSQVHGTEGPDTVEYHFSSTTKTKFSLFGFFLRVAFTNMRLFSSRLANLSHSGSECRARESAILCWPNPLQYFTSISSFHPRLAAGVDTIKWTGSKPKLLNIKHLHEHAEYFKNAIFIYTGMLCLLTIMISKHVSSQLFIY